MRTFQEGDRTVTIEQHDGYREKAIEYPDSDRMTIRKQYDNGVRILIQHHGDSAYHRWVCVPRHLVTEEAIRLARRYEIHPGSAWCYERGYLEGGHYGGVGYPFVDEPTQIQSNRNWLVFCQRGGWDV